MLNSYFKIAWRSIRRYKAYSLINILGLTMGIASCLIIFLVVKHEMSYDAFHRKADRIYRVTLNAIDFNPCVSMAIVPALRTDFPELENVSQVWYRQSGVVKVGQDRYSEKAFAFADSDFTQVFDYQWIAGDSRSALIQPNTVVLTQSRARKYFGDKDPMGQVVNLNNRYDLKVTGLIKDLPGNTHLPFDFLVSFETVKKDLGGALSAFYWISDGSFAYIVTPENYSVGQLQKKIPAFIEKNWGKQIASEARLPLQPLRDIHFDQRYLNNTISPTTSRETYWALAAVAVFIIIIACINFINLATAQAIRRAREIGVRKVLGSNRSQLIWQFLAETSFMVLSALVLALIATKLFLPQTARWLDIKIDFMQVGQPTVLLMLASLIIFIIILAGLYPAFVQSAYRPVQSLKTKMNSSSKGLTLRKSLVVVQFAVSQILIVGTLVVAYQMDFFQNRDLGFNKEAVIDFDIPDMAKRELLRQQLVTNPGTKDVSFSSGAPSFSRAFTSFSSPELGVLKDDVTELKFIDENYTGMFELKMLAGGSIRKTNKNDNDTVYDVVVNETMINKLGIKNPSEALGKHVTINGNWYTTIIGVVRDFQSESKHKKRRPCVLMYRVDDLGTASIRIEPRAMRTTIERIGKSWSALFPEELFEFQFVDDRIASFYRQEQKTYTAFKMFSFIAILIGCLGLYGLVLFATAQRTKEVGIRKVLGASVLNIITLFAREFALLIVVAFAIAAPVGYFTMHNWLENFAYKIPIGGGIFMIAILASFAIAASTIAYQAIRTAIANPVKSLRTE
jgi:putative ABC transport system permease protein